MSYETYGYGDNDPRYSQPDTYGPTPFPHGDNYPNDLPPHWDQDQHLFQAGVADAIFRDQQARIAAAQAQARYNQQLAPATPAAPQNIETTSDAPQRPEPQLFAEDEALLAPIKARDSSTPLMPRIGYPATSDIEPYTILQQAPESLSETGYLPQNKSGKGTMKVAAALLSGLLVFGGCKAYQAGGIDKLLPNEAYEYCDLTGVDEYNGKATVHFRQAVQSEDVSIVSEDSGKTVDAVRSGISITFSFNPTGLHNQNLRAYVGDAQCEGTFNLHSAKPYDEEYF